MTILDVINVMDLQEHIMVICGAREEDEEDESLVFVGTVLDFCSQPVYSQINSEEVTFLSPSYQHGDDLLLIYFEGYDFYPSQWR